MVGFSYRSVIVSVGGDVYGRRRENASIFRAVYGGELETLKIDEREQKGSFGICFVSCIAGPWICLYASHHWLDESSRSAPSSLASDRVRMRRRDQGSNSGVLLGSKHLICMGWFS